MQMERGVLVLLGGDLAAKVAAKHGTVLEVLRAKTQVCKLPHGTACKAYCQAALNINYCTMPGSAIGPPWGPCKLVQGVIKAGETADKKSRGAVMQCWEPAPGNGFPFPGSQHCMTDPLVLFLSGAPPQAACQW